MSESMDIMEEIARVLDIEIEALQSVRDNLSSQFEDAVQAIAGCEGQVFVSGIGKSGIIAQKMAATFCSTGTPALFLHAVDALHGDVGVVRAGDVLLAVGKSGGERRTERPAASPEKSRSGDHIYYVEPDLGDGEAVRHCAES